WRMIRKAPVASLVVVLSLGFGLGANGIFFASFYGSALRPLPFTEPDRLVAIHQTQPHVDETLRGIAAPDYDAWSRQGSVFSAIGAHTWEDYGFQTDDGTYRVTGSSLSASLFPLLGIEPQLGRNFLAEESRPGGAKVALISHRLWLQHFAGDPRVLGQSLKLGGEPHAIVGVMPEGFRFPHNGLVWTPLQIDPLEQPRDARHLAVIARLGPDVELAEAQAAMQAESVRLAAQFPATHEGWNLDVRPLREAWIPVGTAQRQALIAQLALFAGVLLIVCANVTHIMLARVAARRKEMAVRAALGAERGQLIRLSLIESLLLASAGGLVGLGIALPSAHWLQSLIAFPLPYWFDLGLERHGLVYMLVITLGAGLATGLLPSILSTRRGRLAARLSSLRSSGEDVPGGRRWRQGLVVIEYAVALVILATGLLLVKSFVQLERTDRGFATEDVLTLSVPLTTGFYDDGAARVDYLERALRRLDALPGVRGAAATNSLPITETIGASAVALAAQGRSFAEGEEPRVIFQWVSGEYFDLLQIPRVAGRGFAAGEVSEGADVALISESLAAALWPARDPLARRVRPAGSETEAWLDVIGVVGDIEPAEMVPGFGTMPKHRVYLPLAGSASVASLGSPPQTPALVIAATARSPRSQREVLPLVRRALAEIDPTVPPFDLLSMEGVLQRFFWVQHLWSRVFSAMALFVLLLAAVGIYGVMSLSVIRREHELGIRLALGAAPGRLFRRVMREGVALAAIGVGLGLLGAVPLARLVGALLFGAEGLDLSVLASVVALLVALGLVASASPARRAALADPIVALREQ
ncbi:MAG: ADOP family duplicated permease, partial [Acidobacteriota bacterium]